VNEEAFTASEYEEENKEKKRRDDGPGKNEGAWITPKDHRK